MKCLKTQFLRIMLLSRGILRLSIDKCNKIKMQGKYVLGKTAGIGNSEYVKEKQ